MPQITPATTVFVPVSDQDRAAGFYVEALGLEKTADFTYGDGERWVEVGPPGATMHMALTARDDAPAGVETGLAFSTPDVERARAELQQRGASVDEILREGDPPVAWAGATLAGTPAMFTFRDPDGNSFLLVEAA